MIISSAKGAIAIKQPSFTKIETQLQGGIAVNSNRVNLIQAEVVLNYESNGIKLKPGDLVILKGDAGLEMWAKKKYVLLEKEFVLCPEAHVLGFATA
jgi:hypothetical protein